MKMILSGFAHVRFFTDVAAAEPEVRIVHTYFALRHRVSFLRAVLPKETPYMFLLTNI